MTRILFAAALSAWTWSGLLLVDKRLSFDEHAMNAVAHHHLCGEDGGLAGGGHPASGVPAEGWRSGRPGQPSVQG